MPQGIIFEAELNAIKHISMMNKVLSITFLLAMIFTVACSPGKKDSEKATEAKKQELEEFVEEQFEYPIPTSFEVTTMLQDANATYNSEIPNNPENAETYIAQWQQALNLGVYGADLSYASTFNQQEDALKYLEASRKLIDELNITSAFSADLADRLEENIENKDSLILIVTESFYDTYNYLNQSGEEKTSLLVIAGSVIEGLYITTALIDNSSNNQNLMAVLAAQKDQVSELTKLLEVHSEDENVNRVLPFLRYVNLFYDQINEGDEISVGQYEDISKSIAEMRGEIVG